MRAKEGVHAAWRLFLRDATAMSAFDNTVEAARESFRAALIALPLYWLLLVLGPDANGSVRGAAQIFAIHLVFYVLIWTVWPVVMWRICRALNTQALYFRYLNAFNWSMVIQAVIWLFAYAVGLAFDLQGSGARIVTIVAICVVVLFHLHILRSALEITTVRALAIAGFKLVLYQILLGTHHAALLQGSGV